MNKKDQLWTNETCKMFWKDAMMELNRTDILDARKRLNRCQAWVYKTKNYYILRSYSTFIACISIKHDTCFDMLRLEYGYTATSAQHVAKFCYEYGQGKYGCTQKLTWRPV